MHPLSAAILLDVWERGRPLPPPRRALLLLESACPDETPEALAALSVGQCDARLLTLRAWTFGPHLESVVACPACGEPLELTFSVDDVRAEPAPDLSGDGLPALFSLAQDGYEVTFRLPTVADVLALAEARDEDEGRRLLLERCLATAHRRGEADALTAADVPDALVTAMAAQMERADPQANLQLSLTCPACAHRWQRVFDGTAYFWAEIDAWGHRTLYEVHTLARAYGWAEADILRLSAWRRRHYLDLIG